MSLLVHEQAQALPPMVHEQVDHGQVRHERSMQLRIHGMPVVMILDSDAVGGELRLVQVTVGGIAREIAVGTERAADVEEPLRPLAPDAELGAPQNAPLEPEETAQRIEERAVQVAEMGPWPLEHGLQGLDYRGESRGPRVAAPERLEMLAGPRLASVDARLPVGRLALATGKDGDGEPEQALVGFDAVAVPPAVLVVLDVVVEDEDVALGELVKVAEPGEIAGLEHDHALRARRAVRHPSHLGTGQVHVKLRLIPPHDPAAVTVGAPADENPADPPVEDVRDGRHDGVHSRPLRPAFLALDEGHGDLLDGDAPPPDLEKTFRIGEGALALELHRLDEGARV